MNNSLLRRVRSSAALGALLGVFATPVLGEVPHAGQVSWNSGIATFTEAPCGFTGDYFVMSARTEGVRLRLEFPSSGTLEGTDFADPAMIQIRFIDEHVLSGSTFTMYRSLGEMGEIEASPDGARGQLHLRPGSAEALETRPDGMEIAYDFHCTGGAH